jgi:hypothetical protein
MPGPGPHPGPGPGPGPRPPVPPPPHPAWVVTHPERITHWNVWANNVNVHWNNIHYHNDWFRPDWWNHHLPPSPWWYYGHWWNVHPWYYWWSVPAWPSVCTWFEPWGWTEPCYYDYGSGGNVVYQDNRVYIDGKDVASDEEFAQSATNLATVEMPPEADQAQSQKMDWLPLGTFAVSTSEADTSPSCVLQLAVNKEGIVSGTLFNQATDQTYTVQGRVDKKTQRLAFTIDAKQNVVAETGLFNLTQDKTPLLVHFGETKVETYLLVRLTAPKDQAAEGQTK